MSEVKTTFEEYKTESKNDINAATSNFEQLNTKVDEIV